MKHINLREAFSFAFQTLKKYPMLLLGPPIFFNFLSNLQSLFSNKFPQQAIKQQKAVDTFALSKFLETFNKINPYAIAILIFVLVLILIVAIIISTTLEIGRIRIAIHAFNKTDEELTWSVYNNFGTGIIGRYFLASLLLGLIVLAGFLLLIIPGIILALMYQFVLFILVEKKVTISESLKMSNKLTNGIKWELFGYGILIGLITIIILIPILLLEKLNIMYIYLPINTILIPIISMFFSMAMLYIYKDIASQEENLDRLIAESSESEDQS